MFDSHTLICEAQSPDDGIRGTAEARLVELCDANASQVFVEFTQVAANPGEKLTDRQFTLLALRKLVTMYWSPGFESFRGTSTVDLESRRTVREALLHLCLDDNQVAKIRNGASYCVVQISAVDFPDQWPEMLSVIYSAILKHSLAAMRLLNEIYDDVVTEEMFFEEGIGLETMKIIFEVVSEGSASLEAQASAFDLLHCCLLQMSTVDSSSTLKRKDFASQACKEILHVWSQFLSSNKDSSETLHLAAKSKIYEGLTLIKNEFSRKIVATNFSQEIKTLTLRDLGSAARVFMGLLLEDVAQDQFNTIKEFAVNVIEYLTAICNLNFTEQELKSVLISLGKLCCLDKYTTEEWLEDFNIFVSTETGLVPTYSVRDQAAEFLASLSDSDYSIVFVLILDELSGIKNFNENSIINESLLYLLQSILRNDSSAIEPKDKLAEVLSLLGEVFSHHLPCTSVYCRILLVIPKILEKFMESLPNIKDLVNNFLVVSLKYALSVEDDVVRSAFLIAFTYYAYFAELPSVLGLEKCLQIQEKILQLITDISSKSEDDTDGVLMEVLNKVIDCNSDGACSENIYHTEFNLVFTISAKNPANIQTAVESQECLDKLLKNVDVNIYSGFWGICFPPMLNILSGSAQTSFDYSPLLSLTLEFLVILMKRKPENETLSANICNNVFEPLELLLNTSTDEETLQLATEALGYLIYNTETSVILPRLKPIISTLDRLLSPGVPDQGAMHIGSLTVTVFSKFSDEIQSLIPMILEAAAVKLVQATNISTIQNLLSVFCYVTCADAQQTVEFLFSTTIEGANGLTLVLSKWLESFNVIRGENRTKENIIALSKLYFLDDQRLASMQVNGDLIPYESDIIITRSLAKTLPDRYTKISAYQKIIKLFIEELEFQGKQQDTQLLVAGTTISMDTDDRDQENKKEEFGEDEWEDVDGPLEYEQLKYYADESDNTMNQDLDEECLTGITSYLDSRNVQQLLIGFFREVASKNVSGFQDIYNDLSDNEKEILSRNLV